MVSRILVAVFLFTGLYVSIHIHIMLLVIIGELSVSHEINVPDEYTLSSTRVTTLPSFS